MHTAVGRHNTANSSAASRQNSITIKFRLSYTNKHTPSQIKRQRQATGSTNVHRVRPVPTTYGTLNIMNIALDENLYPLTLASFAMVIIKQWDVHLGGKIR